MRYIPFTWVVINDTFINGGSENREEDEHLGVMTRNKAKRNKEIRRRNQKDTSFARGIGRAKRGECMESRL